MSPLRCQQTMRGVIADHNALPLCETNALMPMPLGEENRMISTSFSLYDVSNTSGDAVLIRLFDDIAPAYSFAM